MGAMTMKLCSIPQAVLCFLCAPARARMGTVGWAHPGSLLGHWQLLGCVPTLVADSPWVLGCTVPPRVLVGGSLKL